MEIVAYFAEYLAAYCGVPDVSTGIMPPDPDTFVTVYASDVRPKNDDDGSRIQVIVRGDSDSNNGIIIATRIAEMMDDFSGIFTVDSPYVIRVVLDNGVASLGTDERGRMLYSINFHVYY